MATPTPAVEETKVKATSSGTTPAPAGTENTQENAQQSATGGLSAALPASAQDGAGDPKPESVSGTGEPNPEVQDAAFEEHIAEVCHEANRAYCSMNADHSQVAWKDAPEWQRSSAILGVRAAQAGNTPRQSHEGWMAQKLAEGWRFGSIKDPDAKTHPCLLEYDLLSEEQRAKDIIFVSIVRALTAMRDSR